MKVTVLHTPNSKKGRFALVVDLADWRESARRNRGWHTAAVVYERPATAAERREYALSNRMLCWRYDGWDALAWDEAKYDIEALDLVAPWRRRIFGIDNAEPVRPWAPAYLRAVAVCDLERDADEKIGYVATLNRCDVEHDLEAYTGAFGKPGDWYVIAGNDPLTPDYTREQRERNDRVIALLEKQGVRVYRTNLPAIVHPGGESLRCCAPHVAPAFTKVPAGRPGYAASLAPDASVPARPM